MALENFYYFTFLTPYVVQIYYLPFSLRVKDERDVPTCHPANILDTEWNVRSLDNNISFETCRRAINGTIFKGG